eukprot:TRINITY_DN2842_c0_g1_i3.p1 TRINITY_DN2842_c0_g1~~TRINITY_DN2842_c0_g1_i3.p1  ORF type:complete len:345 (-),score=51.56 TRINITY_DN2842_c0_g1_i3:28-1062(-)
MESQQVEFFVRHTSGTSVPLSLASNATIADIKAKIYEEGEKLPPELRGIHPKHQMLFLQGLTLDDGNTLYQSYITTGITINLQFKLRTLDIFCMDMSKSMFRSNNSSFVLSMLAGQSRAEEAKQLINEWEAKLEVEKDEIDYQSDIREEERYTGLITFSEGVKVHENWDGRIYDRYTQRQKNWLNWAIANVTCDGWFKGTDISQAISKSEEIIDSFRESHKSTSVVRAVLHLLTDGVDTSRSTDQNNAEKRKGLNLDGPPLTIFLYSFASSFQASHSLAKKLGANLIFVKNVADAVREQNNLFLSNNIKPSNGTIPRRRPPQKPVSLKTAKPAASPYSLSLIHI